MCSCPASLYCLQVPNGDFSEEHPLFPGRTPDSIHPCSPAPVAKLGQVGEGFWVPVLFLSQAGVQSQPWQVRINPTSQKRMLRLRGDVGLHAHQARPLLPFHTSSLFVPTVNRLTTYGGTGGAVCHPERDTSGGGLFTVTPGAGVSASALHHLGGLATLLAVTYADRFLLPSPQHFSSSCCFLSAYFLSYTNSAISAPEEFLRQEMPSIHVPPPALPLLSSLPAVLPPRCPWWFTPAWRPVVPL